MFDSINPELRTTIFPVPFNALTIYGSRIVLPLGNRLMLPVKGVRKSHFIFEQEGFTPMKVLVLEPENCREEMPLLIDVHGGAFAYPVAHSQIFLASLYCLKAGCKVFMPDYPLAPQAIYPTALHVLMAFYRYVFDHQKQLGIEPGKIALAGDSAGGNLAALMTLHAQKEGLPLPCGLMLIYPALDATMSTESMKKYRIAPIWDGKNNQKLWNFYCPNPSLRKEASPLLWPIHTPFPATYVETTEFDCLHDEGVLFARKLKEAGIPVELNDTKGTYHGYDIHDHSSIALYNTAKRIRFLRRIFADPQNGK